MLTKDAAICIRAIDYSETSQIVTFFTRETGKVTAIAKGSKRSKSAFDGPIEVFAYGEIVFSDSTRDKLATLTEFQQQPGLINLRSDLFALNSCLFAIELLDGLTDDYDPHPKLFDSFQQFLKSAQVTSHKSQGTLSLLILFQLSLLKEVGLMPILDYCVNCKTSYESQATSDEFYFSSSANGLICQDCEASFPDRIKLTRNAANCLSNSSGRSRQTQTDSKLVAAADKKTLNEIEKILIRYFTDLLHHPPKMAKHVLKN